MDFMEAVNIDQAVCDLLQDTESELGYFVSTANGIPID